MDCGIPCPVGDEARMAPHELGGFGAAVIVFMFSCTLIGVLAYYYVKGDTTNFFVGGRNMGLFVITSSLASQVPATSRAVPRL